MRSRRHTERETITPLVASAESLRNSNIQNFNNKYRKLYERDYVIEGAQLYICQSFHILR